MILSENRAAQYVRVSTDMQRYSIESQSEAIALYAARRGLSIVRSYEDAGKSGLSAARSSLQRLIAEVRLGVADFSVILVFDVSRWGRFQDSDESAYYEFLCKEAGVRVEYCAEMFENDGSLSATVLKNIKRAMAGEFSRELSAKVFAGQAKSVSKGYFIGSKPGYGLRRCIIDELGNRKQELRPGQRKSINTDRTILVPGPPDELDTIRDVYKMFVDNRQSLCAIARSLNDRGIANAEGRQWSSVAIRELLSNEKYIGSSVYNRTSKKLNSQYHRNPLQEWIKRPAAFEPLVSPDMFQRAQQQLVRNARGYSRNEMLDSLSATWCRFGRLSAGVLDLSKLSPCVNAYKEHFGSLIEAYRQIGYPGHFSSGCGSNIRRLVVSEIVDHLRRTGVSVKHERGSSQLSVHDELTVAVVTGSASPPCGRNLWMIGHQDQAKPDILIAVRVDTETSAVREYLLIPMLLLPDGLWLSITEARLRRIKSFRSAILKPLYELCARECFA